jgi:hypothetical protein
MAHRVDFRYKIIQHKFEKLAACRAAAAAATWNYCALFEVMTTATVTTPTPTPSGEIYQVTDMASFL